MTSYLLLLPILLPFLYGIINQILPLKNEKSQRATALMTVLLTSATVWAVLLFGKSSLSLLFHFSEAVIIGFCPDGPGMIFAGMVSLLWPCALCYGFAYMKHDPRRQSYHRFYVASYGAVVGIAFASNLLTLYIFYEILTFVTLPLILHTQTPEARKAGRVYLYYSLSGSSLALAGLVILTVSVGSNSFFPGGLTGGKSGLLPFAYLLTFLGFGVKAAIFPLCHWLPMASAAPTPTTALLHAVAVVKSGAFAVLRCTFYCFTPSLIHNSWAGKTALLLAAFTILYGSVSAFREQHLKRRFAWSTVSNLSYILFGLLLCSGAGLEAALLHFLYHSAAKIGLFFCCGALIETTGAEYIGQLGGMGKKMPLLFSAFTLCGLSLTGIPAFAGFISKYYLVCAAFADGSVFALFGICALILSALLTACYTLGISVKAFAKPISASLPAEKLREPERGFLIPCWIFGVVSLIFGLSSSWLKELISSLTGGVL